MTETRAEKAQRLVDEGRVEIVHALKGVTEAFVQPAGHRYDTIVFDTGHFFCTCSWGAYHSYTPALCAHALAVKLAVERMNET